MAFSFYVGVTHSDRPNPRNRGRRDHSGRTAGSIRDHHSCAHRNRKRDASPESIAMSREHPQKTGNLYAEAKIRPTRMVREDGPMCERAQRRTIVAQRKMMCRAIKKMMWF